MAKALDALGYARVFRHPRTGELIVDTDTLRRGGFGGDDFGGDPDYGDDDFDDDDEDDDEFGDDEVGDDEVGEDEVGARRRRRRRSPRRVSRLARREARRSPQESRRPRRDDNWAMTAVGGTDQLTAMGAGTVKIRLQHDFRAEDITFTGSAAGAKVTSIFFGDRVVWSNSDGIDAGVFASTGFLRGLLKGQSIRAGLDVIVNGTLPGPGDFAVTITGKKPTGRVC